MAALKYKKNYQKNIEEYKDFPKFDDGRVDWKSAIKSTIDTVNRCAALYLQSLPDARGLEEAIIGACLIDKSAFQIAQTGLFFETEPFYTDKHNLIWSAMTNLANRFEAIDILTVTAELLRMQKLEAAEGAYALTELSMKVSSSANLEYHARIVYQHFLRSKNIRSCASAIRKLYDPSEDVFDVLKEALTDLNNYENPKANLKAQTITEVMEDAKNAKPLLQLIGNLIYQGDFQIIFGSNNVGKSIFGIQLADAISKGFGLFGNLLRNECGAQRVLYFDLEMRLANFKKRYTDGAGNQYKFRSDDFFVRIGKNEKNPTGFAQIAENAEEILRRNIEKYKPNVVVIDNMTAITNGNAQDAQIATAVMDTLLNLKARYNLTLIVFAHTPKATNTTIPITSDRLSGSVNFANLADGITAIGSSKIGKSIKYIKQVKVRSDTFNFDEDNIIQVEIVHEGAFLQYKTLEEPLGREKDHLTDFNQVDESEFLEEAVRLNEEEKLGTRKIVEKMGLKMSHTQLNELMKKFKAGVV